MPSVLITGANRGIGLELARQYAADGWEVLACVRDTKKARVLHMMDGEVTVLPLDVTDEKSIRALAKKLQDRPIDLLINNAGIYGAGPQNFGSTSVKGWLETFQTNCIAPLKLLEALAPNLALGTLKTAATVSSLMGSLTDLQSGGTYAYRTSKAAVNMAMAIAARDLKDRGIKVIILNPGWVKTDMGGSAAPLEPADSVAGIRRVLAKVKMSDSGKFINYNGEKLPW
ncbi:MAG TPA: SDR family oxidoreductase [Dongiaceae bacterium]|jgi:NAD(P)-dependent dehydrogenase (short-subunit alcohol dehydrogenase family)|nr:SDR family oxidoreductase [Dongiaceae bacterium]